MRTHKKIILLCMAGILYTILGYSLKTMAAFKSDTYISYDKEETDVTQGKNKKYKVEYELNGGKNSSTNPDYYYKTDKTIVLKAPTRKGYTFEGWYKDSMFTKQVTGISTGSTGKKTFYAKWTANRYYVTFNPNGSDSDVMKKKTCVYGKKYALPKCTYTRVGYTFAGWNTKADGTGKTYADGAKIKNYYSKDKGKRALYAQWSKIKYKITYELDGGTNNSENPKKYYITSKKIVLKEPAKTGYTFVGWYKDAKLSKAVTKIKAGSMGNKTFYAKWTVNKYYVTFDANGGSGTAMAKKKYTYDKKYVLPKCTYTKEGYAFAGWNTKANGTGKTYADEASVKNLYSTQGGTRKLYAKWEPIRYTIQYVLNGGKNNDENPDYYCTGDEIIFANPTRSGYTFAGWYKKANWKTKILQVKEGTTGDLKLYAKWLPNKMIYKFDGNGNTGGAMGNYIASTVGTTYRIADSSKYLKVVDVSTWQNEINWEKAKDQIDAAILRCGYGDDLVSQDDKQFERNASECERLGIPYGVYFYTYATNDTMAKSEAAHLLRLLEGKNITLPVYLDCEENSTISYAPTACEIIGNAVQNAGYLYGVYSNTNWWNNYIPSVTDYTRWVAQYYVICQYKGEYDMWQYSSSGKVSGISGKVDMNKLYAVFAQASVASYTLPANEFIKKGYTFKGWNTAPDGSGIAYADEESVKNSYKNKSGEVTLYAQWEKDTYTISYELNGGVNSNLNPVTYDVDTPDIILEDAVREGYTFVSWCKKEDLTSKIDTIATGSVGDLILYAKWQGNLYTVSFDGNGCTSTSMATQNFRYGNEAKALRANTFTLEGYDFAGWNTAPDGSGIAIADKGLVGEGEDEEITAHLSLTADDVVVLYAQWIPHVDEVLE